MQAIIIICLHKECNHKLMHNEWPTFTFEFWISYISCVHAD